MFTVSAKEQNLNLKSGLTHSPHDRSESTGCLFVIERGLTAWTRTLITTLMEHVSTCSLHHGHRASSRNTPERQICTSVAGLSPSSVNFGRRWSYDGKPSLLLWRTFNSKDATKWQKVEMWEYCSVSMVVLLLFLSQTDKDETDGGVRPRQEAAVWVTFDKNYSDLLLKENNFLWVFVKIVSSERIRCVDKKKKIQNEALLFL